MNKLKLLRLNIIWVGVFTITTIFFLTYNDPFENISLVISSIIFVAFFKNMLKDKSLKSLWIILLTIIIIYMFSVFFVLSQKYELNLKNNNTNNENDDIAVMLVYQGENPMYDMKLETNNIILKDSIINKLGMPFSLYSTKLEYKDIGKSNYREETKKIQARLQKLLPKENKVYIGYLYDKKYVEEKLIDIVNDGYHKIIVVPIFLTEGKYLNILKDRIEKMKLFNLNIKIKYTEPLWFGENIVDCYLGKINNYVNEDKLLDTGIVLIGQGEKEYKNDKFIKSIKQNIMFRKKIKDELVNNLNLEKDKVKLAWLDYIEPNYIKVASSLLEYGVGEIICICIKPQVTYVDNNKIVKALESKMELPEGVKIKLIDGFLYDTKFIYELRNKIQVEKLKTWD